MLLGSSADVVLVYVRCIEGKLAVGSLEESTFKVGRIGLPRQESRGERSIAFLLSCPGPDRPLGYPRHLAPQRRWRVRHLRARTYLGQPLQRGSVVCVFNLLPTGLCRLPGRDGQGSIRVGSTVLLTLAVLTKAAVALHLGRRFMASDTFAILVALLYTFSMPLVDPLQPNRIYLGQLSANVWHNSTTILASALVLPTFVFAVRFLRTPSGPSSLGLATFMALTTLCKPNYTLALLPALVGLWIWIALRVNSTSRSSTKLLLASILPSIAVLVSQYLLVFDVGTEPFSNYGLYGRP